MRASGLTPGEARGKQIYVRGASPSGSPITASLGGDANGLSGETLPCVNCHGLDGRGKPEGGVTPSNIRWSELTKSYGPEHEDGRKHAPYSDRSLKRAITLGLDPAGHVLNPVMPRFRMSWQDLADLVSYIEKLEDDVDTGLSATSVSIGVMLPPTDKMPELANAIRGILDAYAADVNQAGGIFGRSLELRFDEAPSDPARQPAVLRDFIRREQLFALTASYLVHAEQSSSRVLEEERTPCIGPFVEVPWMGASGNPYLFYLDGGLTEEIESLASWAARRQGTEGIVLILGNGNAPIEGRAEASFREHGWKAVQVWHGGDFPPASVVLCLNRETGAAVKRAALLSSHPLILIPGSIELPSIMDLPGAAEGRVALAFSWLPGDEREGTELYRKLAGAHKLSSAQLRSQLLALASIRTLVEGLQRGGQELSREILVRALEGLYQFRTGITPPLTFGPGRRVGSKSERILLAFPRTRSFIPAN